MKAYFFVFFISLASFNLAWAQDKTNFSEEDLALLQEIEDTIGLLSFAVINDSLPEYRFGACRELIPTLVRALKVKNSFKYPFKQLKSISIQYPQDSTFRVFTWQLYVGVNDYRYFGAIQMNTADLQLFPLRDRSHEMEGDVQHVLLSPDQWFGAVYYNLKQVDSPQGRYYLLFGFDGHQFFKKRKLIDVLTFQEEKPVFGAPVFINKEDQDQLPQKSRLLLEYTADASIRLNYDELHEMIIFDHLIPMNGQYGEGMTHFPDGSYEGYRLEDGFWLYVPKIFDQVQEKPPMPHPILGNPDKKKDLFGNK